MPKYANGNWGRRKIHEELLKDRDTPYTFYWRERFGRGDSRSNKHRLIRPSLLYTHKERYPE